MGSRTRTGGGVGTGGPAQRALPGRARGRGARARAQPSLRLLQASGENTCCSPGLTRGLELNRSGSLRAERVYAHLGPRLWNAVGPWTRGTGGEVPDSGSRAARLCPCANPCSGRGSFPRLRKAAMESPEPLVPQQPYQAVARAPTVTGTQTPSGRVSPLPHARPQRPSALFPSTACTPSP